MKLLKLGKIRTSEITEHESVYLCQCGRILPVVLYDVDVVGDSEEAGEG